MSIMPTNTMPDDAARFAAHVKTIAKESQEVLTTHTATGISPELFHKALSLDLRIKSAINFLSKKKIGDHATELNDLNQAHKCLANSTIIPFQTTSMLLEQAAALILKDDSHPKEILAGIMEQGKVKQLLPRIYKTMAELVGTDPGTKSLSEHGQMLFEDETQDRATKAQALIDMAAQAGPTLLPEEHLELMRQINLVGERGRQKEELAKEKSAPVPDLIKPTESETTTTEKVELQPVNMQTEATKTTEQTPVKVETTPVKTKEEEADEALREYRELRAKNSSILTQPNYPLFVTAGIQQTPVLQNQHTSTELLDAELIALNEQYEAARQKVEQLQQNRLFINQDLKLIYTAGVVIPARLLAAEERLKEAQALYNRLNTRADFIEKALVDPKAIDADQLKKELRDLIPNILRAKQEIAVFETNVLKENTSSIKQQTDLNEYEKRAAQIKIDIEAAEAEMFRFPMLVADVRKKKEELEQTKLLETAGQKKIALRHMQADLFNAALWKIPEPAYRSGFVMGMFKEKNISEQTQLWIKEFVFAHSEDQMKTKEGTWIEDHIADDLNLIYLAFEEAVKKFG